MSDLEERLKEIEVKIAREESVLSGFKQMLSAYSQAKKSDLKNQCEDGIQQSENILSFFREERDKLKHKLLLRHSSDSSKTNIDVSLDSLFVSTHKRSPTENIFRPCNSALDFRLHNPALSRSLIGHRLEELQYKLDIESRVESACSRMDLSNTNIKDPSAREAQNQARLKLIDSREKSRIYSLALRGLKLLALSALNEVDENENSELETSLIKPGLRRPMTGQLKIKILAEQNLQNVDPLEAVVNLNVDSKFRGSVKLHQLDRRFDHFVIDVQKANEMELVIANEYREKDRNKSIVGLLWVPIAEINESIRKKNAGNVGWAPANKAGEINVNRSKTVSKPSVDDGSTHEYIEDWFKVEPAGKILLRIDFTKATGNQKPKDGLGRHGAVRKAPQLIVEEKKGHRFVKRHVFKPLTCPVCNKFAVSTTEYQCQDCRFFCHINCAPKVFAKCITRGSLDDATDNNSLGNIYNIPHRFENISSFGANWCCHCGQMLPVVSGKGRRCKDCSITCHEECQFFIPNFCGLTMQMASTLGSVDVKRRSQLPVSPKASSRPSAPQPTQSKPKEQANMENTSISALDSEPSSTYLLPVEPRKSLTVSHPSVRPVSPLPKASKRTITINDYTMLSVLGRGNFGKVMLAEDKVTGGLVAIKALKKDAAIQNDEIEALKSERKVFLTATKEQHPFLINLHACFTTPSTVMFVMDYIVGGDLMSLIQRLRTFSAAQAQFYTIEVLLALECFHKHNIVYRDLKLDNILLDKDGHIRLADYGLCKLDMPFNAITTTFCGTPEFMAPEILLEQKYGLPVDWWAMGVLMYQMILGQSPFTGQDEEEIFDSIIEDEVLYPITLPRATVSILEKLLTRDPKRRLGGGIEDAEEIKRHPYFAGIDWQAHLERRVPPPYQPPVNNNPRDVTNFDPEFTSQPPTLTPSNSVLEPQQQSAFNNFEYVADWVDV